MNLLLTSISGRDLLKGPAAELIALYDRRIRAYGVNFARQNFASEAAMFRSLAEKSGRTRPLLLLAHREGQQVTSEDLAAIVGRAQDDGIQTLVLAIGPADGWSADALSQASRTIAFGRITLPHELAAVVAAEQIYRALTIRAGHPYHSGH